MDYEEGLFLKVHLKQYVWNGFLFRVEDLTDCHVGHLLKLLDA